jgi:hypothetical protein
VLWCWQIGNFFLYCQLPKWRTTIFSASQQKLDSSYFVKALPKMYFFFFLISKFTNTKCLHIPTYVIYVDRLIKYPRTKLRDVVWDDTISIIVSLPFNLIEVNQIDFFYSAEAVLKSVKNLTRIRKSLTIHFWIIGFGNQTKARALRSEYFARNSAYVYWEKHSFGHTPIIAGTLNCLSPLEIWNRSLHHFFQVPPVVVLTQTI